MEELIDLEDGFEVIEEAKRRELRIHDGLLPRDLGRALEERLVLRLLVSIQDIKVVVYRSDALDHEVQHHHLALSYYPLVVVQRNTQDIQL